MGARAEEERRWRLILGGGEEDRAGEALLDGKDKVMDRALDLVYGSGKGAAVASKGSGKAGPGGLDGAAGRGAGRSLGPGGGGRSAGGRGFPGGGGSGEGGEEEGGGDGGGTLGPGRALRWLEEVNSTFPPNVAAVLQKDALADPTMRALLLEPEALAGFVADPSLVAELLLLAKLVPARAKEAVRVLISRLAEDLAARMKDRIERALRGAVDPSSRTRRPRFKDIDWSRTMRANMRTWTPELETIVPEKLVGRGRGLKRSGRRIVLCLDQSGSMAPSVVFASIAACVLAKVPSVSTRLVAFDTEPVDLTPSLLGDPVDLLFGVQLGGGTDIDKALAMCEDLVEDPKKTLLVLVSDLEEGGDRESLAARAARIVGSGATLVCLLALSDEGTPRFDAKMAARMEEAGAAVFGCTPDLFPEMIAAAIERRDLRVWAAGRTGLSAPRPNPS